MHVGTQIGSNPHAVEGIKNEEEAAVAEANCTVGLHEYPTSWALGPHDGAPEQSVKLQVGGGGGH
jgi:hypothetical protein